MALYEVGGRRPVIGPGTWIAPSAEIIGRVVIGSRLITDEAQPRVKISDPLLPG